MTEGYPIMLAAIITCHAFFGLKLVFFAKNDNTAQISEKNRLKSNYPQIKFSVMLATSELLRSNLNA